MELKYYIFLPPPSKTKVLLSSAVLAGHMEAVFLKLASAFFSAFSTTLSPSTRTCTHYYMRVSVDYNS